jgi:hypothetical protein
LGKQRLYFTPERNVAAANVLQVRGTIFGLSLTSRMVQGFDLVPTIGRHDAPFPGRLMPHPAAESSISGANSLP